MAADKIRIIGINHHPAALPATNGAFERIFYALTGFLTFCSQREQMLYLIILFMCHNGSMIVFLYNLFFRQSRAALFGT